MRKRRMNIKNARALIEHEKWLESMGVGKVKPAHGNEIPTYKSENKVALSNKISGHGPRKESMTYSGERKLLGIATMHKSNLVPIFADNKDDAKDIASMRR